jgi:dTDP-4-amino-4,6-dideoxygalactose transaminase
MELLRSHGITRDPSKMYDKSDDAWYYEQIKLGFNYRMTDIQAVLGNSQLNRLDQYVLRRTEIVEWYDELFKGTNIDPLLQKSDRDSSYHLYVVRVRGGRQERDTIYNHLRKNGVGVNLHYIPVYRQPYYEVKSGKKIFIESENYFSKAFSLPIFPSLSQNDLKYIASCIL